MSEWSGFLEGEGGNVAGKVIYIDNYMNNNI